VPLAGLMQGNSLHPEATGLDCSLSRPATRLVALRARPCYREGQSERAIEDLAKSLTMGTGGSAVALDHAVTAMAHPRPGHVGEVREWLAKAHVAMPDQPIMPDAISWERLLLREADVLVLDSTFPADPFAR
jgi:hypothetical protein